MSLEPEDRRFDVLLEEYKFINEYNMKRQFATVENLAGTIIAIGAIIAAASFAIGAVVYVLLLILSLPFYALIWEQLNLIIAGRFFAKYMEEEVVSGLNSLINKDGKEFIGWEGYATSLADEDKKILFIASLPHSGRIARATRPRTRSSEPERQA